MLTFTTPKTKTITPVLSILSTTSRAQTEFHNHESLTDYFLQCMDAVFIELNEIPTTMLKSTKIWYKPTAMSFALSVYKSSQLIDVSLRDLHNSRQD